jgi:hypothetical protein
LPARQVWQRQFRWGVFSRVLLAGKKHGGLIQRSSFSSLGVRSSGSITAVDYEAKIEMKLPIAKIAELTGIHRDTISKRLADLPFEAGKKGAKLYSS